MHPPISALRMTALLRSMLAWTAAERRGLPFRAVSRGVDLTSQVDAARVQSRGDVPAASVDYAAARAALQRHIDALFDEMQEKRRNP